MDKKLRNLVLEAFANDLLCRIANTAGAMADADCKNWASWLKKQPLKSE